MAIWVLTGFMGCGKTSIGRALCHSEPSCHSERSEGICFIDLDEEIVLRCGRSIPEIFATDGEEAFRAIERDTLSCLLSEAGVPPSGVRFAHPTIGQGRRSLSGVPQPPIDLLISLGGGTLMSEECRELVKQNAKCIYLRAKVETLAENLRADDVAGRPMLAGVNPDAPADAPDSLKSRIASMMAERGPIYEKAADIILDIDGLSYEDAARQVLNSFFQ